MSCPGFGSQASIRHVLAQKPDDLTNRETWAAHDEGILQHRGFHREIHFVWTNVLSIVIVDGGATALHVVQKTIEDEFLSTSNDFGFGAAHHLERFTSFGLSLLDWRSPSVLFASDSADQPAKFKSLPRTGCLRA